MHVNFNEYVYPLLMLYVLWLQTELISLALVFAVVSLSLNEVKITLA